jgi:hypothetical protein
MNLVVPTPCSGIYSPRESQEVNQLGTLMILSLSEKVFDQSLWRRSPCEMEMDFGWELDTFFPMYFGTHPCVWARL